MSGGVEGSAFNFSGGRCKIRSGHPSRRVLPETLSRDLPAMPREDYPNIAVLKTLLCGCWKQGRSPTEHCLPRLCLDLTTCLLGGPLDLNASLPEGNLDFDPLVR